jgi:Methyltransferase domain
MAHQGPADFWDQRYGARGVSFGATPNVFLASQAARFAKGQRVLVPGDGEGRNGVWLAGLGLAVDTVDASPIGVANALALAAERGVKISAVAADLTSWPWPVSAYDAVVSIYLHFPSAVRRDLHGKMLASLKPGGLIILEGYTPKHLDYQAAGSVGGPQDADMLFTLDMLRGDFADADIVQLDETDVVLAEGTRHRGRSAVVRLIARRR